MRGRALVDRARLPVRRGSVPARARRARRSRSHVTVAWMFVLAAAAALAVVVRRDDRDRLSLTLVPARRQLGELPSRIRTPLLPSGRPRRSSQDALTFGANSVDEIPTEDSLGNPRV